MRGEIKHARNLRAFSFLRQMRVGSLLNETSSNFQHLLPIQIDVIVTTAGGIEEDFVKCLAPTYTGDFCLSGKRLREAGLNRIGNLLVPNDNYCKFEDWVTPILDTMLEEQKTEVTNIARPT